MRPSVGLHEANDDISTPLASPVTLVEHGVGLPDTRSAPRYMRKWPAAFDPVGSVLGRGRLGDPHVALPGDVCHCDTQPPLTVVVREPKSESPYPSRELYQCRPQKPPPFTPF